MRSKPIPKPLLGNSKMPKPSDEEVSTSDSDEPQNPQAEGVAVNEYEKQRQARIAQNRARMEALGLMGPTQIPDKKTSSRRRNTSKGKAKMVLDDEDYKPQEEQPLASSSSSTDDDYEDEGFSVSAKAKRKSKGGKPKNARSKSSLRSSKYLEDDDDDAMKQAVALSLQGSTGTDVVKDDVNLRKGENQNQQDSGRKRKKPFTSRIQMTEDELVLHFFQLDENCNGGVSARDLEKIAFAHDFTWTDKELADMINFFDSDRDGKLSLEDFRKVVVRCNMIKAPEDS